jgi:hypothetical protein
VHEGPPVAHAIDIPDILPVYGDPLRDVRKVRDKVILKFRQLREGTGVVAIWNDDGDLEDLEACQGVAEIAREVATGVLSAPPDVFLVVYASELMYISRKQQVYCFELRPEYPDFLRRWARELESSTVAQLLEQALPMPD